MGAGRRRAALVVRTLAAGRARPRPRRLPAGPAGRPARDGLRRRPLRFGRQRGPRGRARVPARDAQGDAPRATSPASSAFGKDALVERLPAELDARSTGSRRHPVKSATDIGAALRLASALFPDDAQKRIVLLSDGNDTTGAGQAEAALAAARGVQIETRRIGLGDADEVLVERLTTPSTARLGEAIEAVAEIRSIGRPDRRRSACSPTATWSPTQPVDLEAGRRPGSRSDVKPTEAGFHTFRAVVEAARDTFSQNDRADSNTIVKGEPRTLVLAGDDAVAAELVAALESQRQQVDTIVPEALPTDFAGLADLRQRRARRRAAAAPDRPAAGGAPGLRPRPRQGPRDGRRAEQLRRRRLPEDAARGDAAGRHGRARPAEAARHRARRRHRQVGLDGRLPLQHVQRREGGGTGIGGVQKVDIGKEAILRAAAAMTERDELGVVGFNEAAHWVVRTQPLGGDRRPAGPDRRHPRGRPDEHLRRPRPGRARRSRESTATRRHIILLTDGWSTSGQYDAILAKMKADGITLSTVGAGGGANPFLEQLAKQGGGRFYAAANPASIPDIFLKETQQVSGQQIVEEPFFPIQTSSSPILRGLDAGPAAAPRLQRDDRPSRPPRPCS